MTVTQQQKPSESCVYCSVPLIRLRAIFQDELVWAFPTNIPITPGHTLISPVRCTPSLDQLSDEERTALLAAAQRIMVALRTSHKAEGFNCVWNEGRLAGQSVPHLHLHVIPRKEGDTGLLGYDPRSMLYRTGEREPTREEELLTIRDAIREALL